MGKQKSLLHKSSNDYDSSNPKYACGAPVEHNPNLTDAQAMALGKCPNCFSFKEGSKLNNKVSKEGWI